MDTTRSLLSTACCGLLIVALGGCVTSTIQEVRESPTGLSKEESVVVLGRRHKGRDATEDKFVDCVSERLGRGKDGLGIIGDDEFVDSLFPWFEPRTAPLKTSDLPRMLSRPLLAERLTEIGLRYMVWIEGSTERIDSAGSMTCSITATGAGCFGFLSWEDGASYEASIWDIKNAVSVGKISSDATGTSFVPAVVVPIPFIARVQHSACNSMADQLKSFILN
ncbi:MAG: hypothetical protein E2O54_14490 [Gammaproteobacteria bacterium]|nr:MAG: hypothetical protein E2O58_05650 [Gammaproteobacteria bacterium]TDJ37813.1 MAG: hypothetical protein E2O54_14490 [Gammaproteobacteria bacterium]